MADDTRTPDPVRILILGGGFGGVYTALRLLRRRGRAGRPLEITVVNRDNFFLFTPMLHEVAASDLDITHIVSPLRKLLPGATLFVGEVEAIDLVRRRVRVSHAGGGHRHDLPYDHLVLALGAHTNFFDLPGVEDGCVTMKSLADAVTLRNRMIEFLDEADFECALEQRHALLTFLVAGGGFAGVETVAAMHDFLHEAVGFYPHLDQGMIRVILVHAGPTLLPELGTSLGEYARMNLERRGIEVRVDTRVRGFVDGVVQLSDGTAVSAQTLVWTAGTAPHPHVAALPCAERGRVPVDPTLAVPGWPGVWALGDCAVVPDARTGGIHPPTAQHALRQGRVLADNIVASLTGRPAERFEFRTIGQLAAIGRRTGVADIRGRRFSGFPAWWLWRTIYLSKLPRLERKIRVVFDWTLDLVFSKDLVQLKAGQEPEKARRGTDAAGVAAPPGEETAARPFAGAGEVGRASPAGTP